VPLASPLASSGLYFILPRLQTSSARGAAWPSTACGPACGGSSVLWPGQLEHSRSSRPDRNLGLGRESSALPGLLSARRCACLISAVKADPTAGRQFRRNKTPPLASVHPNPNSFRLLPPFSRHDRWSQRRRPW
jgi:hypothetical protein